MKTYNTMDEWLADHPEDRPDFPQPPSDLGRDDTIAHFVSVGLLPRGFQLNRAVDGDAVRLGWGFDASELGLPGDDEFGCTIRVPMETEGDRGAAVVRQAARSVWAIRERHSLDPRPWA